ncbi:hypothetical protein [Streptomyces sp. AGS-58]|uniref:hypothetical protein n=1 Tax=unclassified Streptomyces TaxID=2593676 RepID=UPI0035A35684
MSATPQRPELRFPPVENGLDYLVDVTNRLTTPPGVDPTPRDQKYAVRSGPGSSSAITISLSLGTASLPTGPP